MSYVVSLIACVGPLETFLVIGSFLLLAAWLAQFGPATRQKRLDEVSPQWVKHYGVACPLRRSLSVPQDGAISSLERRHPRGTRKDVV